MTTKAGLKPEQNNPQSTGSQEGKTETWISESFLMPVDVLRNIESIAKAINMPSYMVVANALQDWLASNMGKYVVSKQELKVLQLTLLLKFTEYGQADESPASGNVGTT